VFIADDKALRTGLQGEGRKDGVQGADLSEELPDDPGGSSISFPVGYLKNTSLSHQNKHTHCQDHCIDEINNFDWAGKREADGLAAW
jgi:hypothetical protein